MEALHVRSLEETPFTKLYECFHKAFANYFVPMMASEEEAKRRWHGARVEYSLSFGAFADDDHLVGFVLFAIGDLQGKRNAHNSGTGVIPEFRGRRIVEQIYGVALPILKMNGVLTSTVEAITLNERAIRAYRKVGYEITRKLRCFGGKIDCKISEKVRQGTVTINKEIDWTIVDSLCPPYTSWEHSKESLSLLKDDYEQWLLRGIDGDVTAFAVVNPSNGYVAQMNFVHKCDNHFYGTELLWHLGQRFETVKCINIDEENFVLVKCLEDAGLQSPINQYELSMKLL